MKTQQLSRNEFIRKFNGLEKQAKAEILLKAGLSKERLEELGDLNGVEASDVVECYDADLIADVWSIMEDEN